MTEGFKDYLILEKAMAEYKVSRDAVARLSRIPDLSDVVDNVGAWFYGSYMSRDINRKKIYQSLQSLRQMVKGYPPKNVPNSIYRCTLIQVDGKSDDQIRNIKKIVTGEKFIQSWTTDNSYPKKFYNNMYDNVGRGKDKNHAWVAVKAHTDDMTPLFSLDSARQMYIDLYAVHDQLDLKGYMSQPGMIRQQIKELESAFIKKQQEIVCYAPNKIPVEIYDIFWSRDSHTKWG
jgi:hypothetical protein